MDLQTGRPNALLKSKSSNTRVKERVDEKKSKSSGEFKTSLVKKRGVYVEKRASSPGPDPHGVVSPKIKAPPRSRPGVKPFLDSVLSILSKTTTGTQFPIRSPKMSKIFQPMGANCDEDMDLWFLEQNATVKKSKHKKGEQNPKSKRDLISRDLHHSKEILKRKLAGHVPEEARAQSEIDLGERKAGKRVIEGNRMHLEKEVLDPVTLVNTAAKDDKLYSLFVNLLETVYNAKTNKDAPCRNTKSVKINTQKDGSLTKKEPRREVSPTDKLFMNSRFAKVTPQPFDSKWREHELEVNIEESTHHFEVDSEACQTNVFEEVENGQIYRPRSKAFTDEVCKELPEQKKTLKSKHELRNNVISSTSKDNDRLGPEMVNSETGEVMITGKAIDVENSIARTVMEGNRLNMEKKTDTTTTSGPEKEKKLYSLFVNLLETVYPDLQSPVLFHEVSNQSSKLQFEMEVNAAQKLNNMIRHTNDYFQPPCLHCKPRGEGHQRKRHHRDNSDAMWSHRDDQSEAPESRVRKRAKRHANKHESPERRAPTYPRPLRKKTKKQELLAIIKQKLTRQDDSYKEPATFYDALRIMAKNRRKDYNDTNFIRRAQENDIDFDSACRFKKRKAARDTRARPTRYPNADNRKAPATARFRYSQSEYRPPYYEAEPQLDSDDSYHSLAVYGYDYIWKPHLSKSSTSSADIIDYEVTYNRQTTVGSQCCNHIKQQNI